MTNSKIFKIVYSCCLALLFYSYLNTYLNLGHILDIFFNMSGILFVIEVFVIGSIIATILGTLSRVKEPKANLKIAATTYSGAIMIAIFEYITMLFRDLPEIKGLLFLDLIEWIVLGTIVTLLIIALHGKHITYKGKIGLVYLGSFLMFLGGVYWEVLLYKTAVFDYVLGDLLNYFIQGTIVLFVLMAYRVINWKDK